MGDKRLSPVEKWERSHDISRWIGIPAGRAPGTRDAGQITPKASMASATRVKPAIFAPAT
jgi:hypothetical protein